MPRSLAGVRNIPRSPSTYSLPPGTTPQVPNTVISSSMFTAFADDVAQTFNTVQPIVYGGTGSNDLKLTDADFGIKDNGDPTKIGQFNASNLPTATTRTYDLPYYSGTLGLVSDIRGYLYGLTLSNNTTDLTNDIDVAAGSAVDSTGTASMLLSSALGKRADATWVAGGTPGSTSGGRFYTTLADGTIHFYLIRNPTTGVVDAGFSDNVSNPTAGSAYPAGFTQYRRIGSFTRVGGVITPFRQIGDTFYIVPTPFMSAVGVTSSGGLYATGCPLGLNLELNCDFDASIASGTIVGIKVSSPLVTDTAPASGNMSVGVAIGAAAVAQRAFGNVSGIMTDTSGQIRVRAFVVTTTVSANLNSYTDTRGRT